MILNLTKEELILLHLSVIKSYSDDIDFFESENMATKLIRKIIKLKGSDEVPTVRCSGQR